MKISYVFLSILLFPLNVFAQSQDTVIVYRGDGAFENYIIDLSNQNLNKIPSKAVNFQVEVLILDNNNITNIPNWIGNLTNLRVLSLRNNNLLEINDIIVFCESLEELYLSGNLNLSRLPSLSRNKTIKIIDVTRTGINDLPTTIRGMENIAYFKYSKKN